MDSVGYGISEADLIYHSIFIISLFFQILLVVDALWNRNTVQIVALVKFNLLTLAYAAIQLYQHEILEDQGTLNANYTPINPIFSEHDRNAPKIYYEARMRPIEHTIIALISAFSIYLAVMSYLLTKEFGWENYRTYSADIRVRDTFWNLTILQTLIKMDVFFIGSYALQLIPSQQIGYYSSIAEIVLVFFFGTLTLLISWISVVKEMKYLLLSAINLYSISLIYWSENEPEGRSPYLGTDNLESSSSKRLSKRESVKVIFEENKSMVRKGIDKDTYQAFVYYQESAKMEYIDETYIFELRYENGIEVEMNECKNPYLNDFRELQQPADTDKVNEMDNVNRRKALKRYLNPAEVNKLDRRHNLGQCYEYGIQDEEK
ncbi:6355_t:CDS:2 [Dentiscutata heterogama]|uniref:6355_t:CDS:1 n=1 Tax=Dentiscutata heterogama TaxID=1316150 RepID=A0ACA9L1E6_9GLOM|nr:6355_t:CDS:2 [Dentiscutata heterogama]